jgi:molybdate transport system permease protein
MTTDLLQVTMFTLAVALTATVLLLLPGTWLAWLFARREFPGKALLETMVSLPLVMPPVATGLIILWMFGIRGPLGGLGLNIFFTWKAVVLAMAVMGLPLLVRTARPGFEQVPRRYELMAASLGASPRRVFWTITLPLAKRSLIAGGLLAFSRALGEFGATVVVAGSIPGRTLTLPVAIYAATETGQDARAAAMLAISVTMAFGAVWISNRLVYAAPEPH